MPKIFISYRREDSKHAVGRLHAALKRHVRNPKRDIFIDIDNIPKGVDFVKYLDQQVSRCDVMLAVIGPSWLDARDPSTNRRRLDDPSDFVRVEIASALRRGIPVVPIVLDETKIPTEAFLPDDIRALARRNGERLEHESFDSDVARLIHGLSANTPSRNSESTVKPIATVDRNPSGRRLVVMLCLALLAGSAIAFFATDQFGLGRTSNNVDRTTPAIQETTKPSNIASRLASGDVRAGERSMAKCGSCHSWQNGVTGQVGPNLYAVVGRPVGADPAFRYSEAMRDAGGVWNADSLDRFLENGRAAIPGTAESFVGIRDPAERADIIVYLMSLADAAMPAMTVPPTPRTPQASRKAGAESRDCAACPEMVALPGGNFMMGSPSSEDGHAGHEGPQLRVNLLPFAIGKYEVTRSEWDQCVSEAGCPLVKDDGVGKGRHPVTNVAWDDAQRFVSWLNGKTHGAAYRLPSEAEWEYAARGGTTTPYSFGRTITTSQANFGSTLGRTAPVGQYPANAFGLHDMHGNVWEWTADCSFGVYDEGFPSDGRPHLGGGCFSHTARGGSWIDIPQSVRSANRVWNVASEFTGFRVAKGSP